MIAVCMYAGVAPQLSGGGKAVDESPSDGMAAKHRPLRVCTQPPRQRRTRRAHGMHFVYILSHNRNYEKIHFMYL